ncbi:hypothetical protein M011DRAFT_210370 [Sporormia fimetaria CBS 119925]|uniref:Uncharacterized protein n=1 Tax=Sporormia fimetaria CBS 119925 TaxID=1340428 RepID=A0A6A6UZX8_9PLEO|nr:hypothetical protein M011DRAFT_210370 [Sporormia fimetaria CBS 119925]
MRTSFMCSLATQVGLAGHWRSTSTVSVHSRCAPHFDTQFVLRTILKFARRDTHSLRPCQEVCQRFQTVLRRNQRGNASANFPEETMERGHDVFLSFSTSKSPLEVSMISGLVTDRSILRGPETQDGLDHHASPKHGHARHKNYLSRRPY